MGESGETPDWPPAIAPFLICMECFCCIPHGYMERHYDATHPDVVLTERIRADDD